MKKLEILKSLKNLIWSNKFNLTIEEKSKFEDILIFFIHNRLNFKNEKQRENFINKVLNMK